ncbi:hypothetical protein [Capnocytophaga sp. oral taxon 878]|uniref:hypothetical protein n=1 Tax=Capnocytophaga sp. oral taxon 878 TaxID=1316596 RepID=UPI000D03FB9C|nr:hypothetical protein [Capnocytophaga sp. oral taxon 878]AVM49734.1 hypothetical protein C4H12_04200 [Capnocytophaga sp. oral taxon 878]
MMLHIRNKIGKEYSLLYDKGYRNEIVEEGLLFSSLTCSHPEVGLIFNFSIEKGVLSIAVTTKELLEKKVSFDFFYILKVLYPERRFEEIKELSYQEEVAANLLKVEELFSEKQICNTIEKLTSAIKQYSKERFT